MPFDNRFLSGLNRLLLVIAQREVEIKGLRFQLLLCSIDILLKEFVETFRAVPAIVGLAIVLRAAQVTKPDPGHFLMLKQVGTPIGCEGKGDFVGPSRSIEGINGPIALR